MASRANVGSWLFRLITWDGLLPATVWSAPFFIELAAPNNRGAIEIISVALPIVAFCIRYRVGRRHIASNGFGPIVRGFQLAVFCVGLVMLVFIDAVMILSHVMPKGAAFATLTDCIIWAAIYFSYLMPMAVAMYPGPLRTEDQFDLLLNE
ncbi:MAG: hypothetical protein HQ582_13060 [Planctomycetes bacterium]|nr:hypothetical protein [Planctomycetota bacterium]